MHKLSPGGDNSTEYLQHAMCQNYVNNIYKCGQMDPLDLTKQVSRNTKYPRPSSQELTARFIYVAKKDTETSH
jgi:hypothetical protein